MSIVNFIVQALSLSIILVIIAVALSGCGNTVKGVGTDIVKMGESLMEEDTKNEKENYSFRSGKCYGSFCLFIITRCGNAGFF